MLQAMSKNLSSAAHVARAQQTGREADVSYRLQRTETRGVAWGGHIISI